jgi:hypothetical protein
MRLRTRLIVASSYLAWLLVESLGWGPPWLRMLAAGLMAGIVLIYIAESRLGKVDAHTTLNLHR